MKIVFLDIDGVLQPLDRQAEKDEFLKESLIEKNSAFVGFDSYTLYSVVNLWHTEAISFLKNLLEENQARIVLTSSWRKYFTFNELKLLFSLHGLENYLFDTIPVFGENRAAEIALYLLHHPKITQFVILEDNVSYHLDKIFPKNLVLTSYFLDHESFIEANNILKSIFPINLKINFAKNLGLFYEILWYGNIKMIFNWHCKGSVVLITDYLRRKKKYFAVWTLFLDEKKISGYYTLLKLFRDYEQALKVAMYTDKLLSHNPDLLRKEAFKEILLGIDII